MRIFSQVAKLLETYELKELANNEKKKKFGWRHNQVPSCPYRNQTLTIAVIKHVRVEIQLL